MNRIFRSIHTIKGASSFLGFDLLVKVAHKTEDVLNRLRKGELLVSPEIMDVILEATDLVKLLVSDIKAGDIQERETDGTINKLLPFLLDTAGVPKPVVPAPQSDVQPVSAPETAEATLSSPQPQSPTATDSPSPAVELEAPMASPPIQPSPAMVAGGIDQECIAGVINQAERLLVLLNLEKMFSRDEKNMFTGM